MSKRQIRLGAFLFGVGHHLGDAVVVAQVDEEEPAMVAHAMDPAGKAHILPRVFGAKGGAGVATVAVHGRGLLSLERAAWGILSPPCQGAWLAHHRSAT